MVNIPYSNRQLEIGIRHELEHGKDRAAAERIARQHLHQYPTYYKRLAQIEPLMKRDRRRKLRKIRQSQADQNYNPFNLGSPFG
jgi:hypothetical protein